MRSVLGSWLLGPGRDLLVDHPKDCSDDGGVWSDPVVTVEHERDGLFDGLRPGDPTQLRIPVEVSENLFFESCACLLLCHVHLQHTGEYTLKTIKTTLLIRSVLNVIFENIESKDGARDAMNTLYDIIHDRLSEIDEALHPLRLDPIYLEEDGDDIYLVEIAVDHDCYGAHHYGGQERLVRFSEAGVEAVSEHVTPELLEAVEAAITGPAAVYEPDHYYAF